MRLILIAILMIFVSGCNVSPLSPRNNPRINNQNGTIEEIRNNQNGLMLDLANIRGKLELMARDVENLQQGIVNSNNKNYGVQIFQGEVGLFAGLGILCVLGVLVYSYRTKAEKYKKTAEILGKEIKSLASQNKGLQNNIYMTAMKNKVEEEIYKILKN